MKIALVVLIVLVALVALGIVLLVAGDNGPDSQAFEAYREALSSLQSDGVSAPPPGSVEEQEALARFKALFADLSPGNVGASISSVYAPSLFFNDTVKTIRTESDLRAYLLHTAESVESCTVDMIDVVRSGDDFYFRWEMEIVFKALHPGRVDRTAGMTHVRFNPEGLIVLHQDFWDPARGIYEHVPILGAILRKIKARL